MTGQPLDRQRLDSWLVVARFAKTRARAAALVEAGSVKINGRLAAKPAQTIRPGDVLILPRGRDLALVEVLELAPRRGPAQTAGLLYRDLEQDP
jgi:ribosome-associated heat shock protein Hsp15